MSDRRGPLDPDRFQMRDIKRRLLKLENAHRKLKDRYERNLTQFTHLRASLKTMEDGLGMLFGSAWLEATDPKRKRGSD